MTRMQGIARVAGGNRPAVVQSVALSIVAVIPGFLVGALAVGIRRDLDFGPAALGLAAAWFFMTTALAAALLGRVVERVGVRASMLLGAGLSALALAAVGGAGTYPLLLAALTMGGVGNAISQPAVNAALSIRIPRHRLGLAFGIKQSSIPAATLLGGLAIPTVAVLLGWRGTFFVAAGAAALVGLTALGVRVPRPSPRAGGSRSRLREGEVRALVVLTVGGAFSSAAATSLGTFLVDSAVVGGIRESSAGLLFAAASAVGLSVRVFLGWYADAHPRRSRYGMIIGLVLGGALGFLALASGVPALYLLGAFVAYGAGWGWTGLFHYAVVADNPGAPATATGVIQSGLAFGAGMGPLLLGVIAESRSYSMAWLAASALALAGASIFWQGRRMLRQIRWGGQRRPPDPVPSPPQRPTSGEVRGG